MSSMVVPIRGTLADNLTASGSAKQRRSLLTRHVAETKPVGTHDHKGPPMTEPYLSTRYPIRDDLTAAHARAWSRIARPGTWWDGTARIAIAAAARLAPSCTLCRRRKEALSPLSIESAHDGLGQLPEIVVEVAHRVRTDPGRLGERWYRSVIARGLTEGQYVEIVSVVAHTVAIDTMARGLGIDAPPLPDPKPGSPSHYRPGGAKLGGAWVPWVEPADAGEVEAGIYPGDRLP